MLEIEFRGLLLEDILYLDPRITKIPPSFNDISKYGPKIIRHRKGEWVYGNLVTDSSKCWIVGKVTDADNEHISFESWFPVNPATIGQSIGRRDKDGTEIYTGDILGGMIGYGIVCWDTKGARFAIDVDGELDEVRFEELETKDLKVINNIYRSRRGKRK